MTAAVHIGIAGFAAEPPEFGGQTLVLGTTFAVAGPDGDIGGQGAQGLFVRDARVISRWQLRIDGEPVQPLGGFSAEPFAGVFLGRGGVRDGRVEPTLLVERRRVLGGGMSEVLLLRNYGREPAGVNVSIELASDFADLFAVKVGAAGAEGQVEVEVGPEEWRARMRGARAERSVRVRAAGATVAADRINYQAVVPASGMWSASIEVTADGSGPLPSAETAPEGRRRDGGAGATRAQRQVQIEADSMALTATVSRSQKDLVALMLADPDDPAQLVVAAGAPWFMALFGRDSLLASSMALAVNPDLAVGTLRALARRQGRRVDPMTEEEPGRILHELRSGVDPAHALGGADRYYGSVDATPLFVMLLGQAARWGADPQVVDELLPAADRALEWIGAYGDRDGDGFVEYKRATDRGLRNQGWKDSADAVTFADGTEAEPPIALVEVQGYVYGAYRARSELARHRGDASAARHWAHEADALKRRIDDAFWMPSNGYYAMALDAEKRQVDALASNMGHLLWAGAAEPGRAAAVAERLLSPELFSGYGIRTLATTMRSYNPASYHNGSVWPHDTALAVAGLCRYGFTRHAARVAVGLVEAASYFSGRLPELFCGFDKTALPGPVPYPTSCSPQAWASAAPVAMLVALLGLEPDVPSGAVGLAPAIPEEWGAVEATGIPLGSSRLAVTVDRQGAVSSKAGGGLRVTSPGVADRV